LPLSLSFLRSSLRASISLLAVAQRDAVGCMSPMGQFAPDGRIDIRNRIVRTTLLIFLAPEGGVSLINGKNIDSLKMASENVYSFL
jgi:hypothetical protein